MARKQTVIEDDVKKVIESMINKFLANDSQTECSFPCSFSSEERKYVHVYCRKLGLKTKSRGIGSDRFVTVYKKSEQLLTESYFQLKESSKYAITTLLAKYPVSAQERSNFKVNIGKKCASNDTSFLKELKYTIGRLSDVIPQIPSSPNYSANINLTLARKKLPIWNMQDEIMELINNNQVVIISGDTGCGKTTQVPQFILEHCRMAEKCCRVITTEPRRLAVLSVADRVSKERGEAIGSTVGYQIKLESKVSPKTLLTFCTNGILLRTLMSGEISLNTVTHIIIDDVHERDKYSDFLLLTLKHYLSHQKHVKLVLMSATIDIERFCKYFDHCDYIQIPRQSFTVQSYFLADILITTGYKSSFLKPGESTFSDKSIKQNKLLEWCQEAVILNQLQPCKKETCFLSSTSEQSSNDNVLDCVNMKAQMDAGIQNAWISGDIEHFEELLSLIINDNCPVNYRHSETGTTALIAAAYQGKLKFVETLLGLDANVKIRDVRDWDAYQWAKYLNRQEIVELFDAYLNYNERLASVNVNDPRNELIETKEEQQLLDAYYKVFPNEDEVDIELIAELILNICRFSESSTLSIKGTILIFLPGYDEIVSLREVILTDVRFKGIKLTLFTLHSQMQSNEQWKVFEPACPGVRKIILSTNLTETTITIDDVVYVIDSGKVKEKAYDKILGVSLLKSSWISKASAMQRRGRAGRCQNGVCFHLFSKARYSTLSKFQVPEILRMPVHELCLQTKLLAPKDMNIVDFFSRALDAPPASTIRDSIELLKIIDALDSNEQLTEIGLHLLDLPIEPNLGKMVLNAVVLKCLDPVLTIVCGLAYRDPFIISPNPKKKKIANDIRNKLSMGTLSDHMVILRLFQQWQKACSEGYEKSFLERNFVRSATMEMIVGMRAQLLGQLRASGFVRSRGSGDIRDLNVNSDKWGVVKAALTAGAYPNLIQRINQKQISSAKIPNVYFHPSSTLISLSNSTNSKLRKYIHLFPSDWFIFQEMINIGNTSYARGCSIVHPFTVALFTGPYRLFSETFINQQSKLESDSEGEDRTFQDKPIYKIDNWIYFRFDLATANLISQLRILWHSLFSNRMRQPSKPLRPSDDYVLKCIINIITEEEKTLGLPQPAGIGQRPKLMAIDFCPFFDMG